MVVNGQSREGIGRGRQSQSIGKGERRQRSAGSAANTWRDLLSSSTRYSQALVQVVASKHFGSCGRPIWTARQPRGVVAVFTPRCFLLEARASPNRKSLFLTLVSFFTLPISPIPRLSTMATNQSQSLSPQVQRPRKSQIGLSTSTKIDSTFSLRIHRLDTS